MKPAALILLLALPLGGCETLKGSVAGSCAVFERPPYAVRGKTPYDQDVADNFVESGVAGCNWQRPAPRPASLDAPVKPKGSAVKPKRGFVKRITERVKQAWPTSAPAIVPVPAPPPIVIAPEMTAPLPKPPRSALDELLQPSR